MSNKKESEFGKGFAYPILLFAMHCERHTSLIRGLHSESDKRILKEVYEDDTEKWLSSQIETHFNGASDHLYELEIPEQYKNKKIGKLAKKLQDKALKIGHGFTGETWTQEDFFECYDLAKEIMFLLDKELGLKPIKGDHE